MTQFLESFSGYGQEVAADAALQPVPPDLRLSHLQVNLPQRVVGFGKLVEALQGAFQIGRRRLRLALQLGRPAEVEIEIRIVPLQGPGSQKAFLRFSQPAVVRHGLVRVAGGVKQRLAEMVVASELHGLQLHRLALRGQRCFHQEVALVRVHLVERLFPQLDPFALIEQSGDGFVETIQAPLRRRRRRFGRCFRSRTVLQRGAFNRQQESLHLYQQPAQERRERRQLRPRPGEPGRGLVEFHLVQSLFVATLRQVQVAPQRVQKLVLRTHLLQFLGEALRVVPLFQVAAGEALVQQQRGAMIPWCRSLFRRRLQSGGGLEAVQG